MKYSHTLNVLINGNTESDCFGFLKYSLIMKVQLTFQQQVFSEVEVERTSGYSKCKTSQVHKFTLVHTMSIDTPNKCGLG